MKEACENLQNAEVEPREKLKVTKADIVVALPLGKPYFNIHYREVGNYYDNIGFGSYDLNNVIRWREEEMEIVSEVEAEYKDKFTSVGTYEQVAWERNVAIAQLKELGYGLGEKIRKVEAEYGNGWIPCSERLPEEPEENPEFDGKALEVYLVSLKGTKYPWRAFWNGKDFTDGWSIVHPEAWMPLPEAYKPEKGEKA